MRSVSGYSSTVRVSDNTPRNFSTNDKPGTLPLNHGLPRYEINKLQSVQNSAARVIACLRKFDHISDTLKELHWLPVEQRIIFKINLVCFKILNNLAPDYLVD